MEICGIVTWYNPSIKELSNIKSYIKYVDRLIVVDNSQKDNSNMIEGLKSIEYISNMENLGIARALNIGCEKR